VLVAVPGQYFERAYIDRQRWLAYWRQAARNPLITQVDVRAVKAKTTGNDKIG
jgi:hypothetical protein